MHHMVEHMIFKNAGKIEKCHYCEDQAEYDDVVIPSDVYRLDKNTYALGGVCKKHAYRGLTS